MNFESYETGPFFDEMFTAPGFGRDGTELLRRKIDSLPSGDLKRRQAVAEKALFDLGITFNVYGHDDATEKIWPFDVVPRIVHFNEWQRIEAGLKQRIHALNLFIDDIYHDQKIVKDKIVPAELIATAEGFLEPCLGLNPPNQVRHAGRAGGDPIRMRGLCRKDQGGSAQLRRPADHQPLPVTGHRGRCLRRSACRPAALHSIW